MKASDLRIGNYLNGKQGHVIITEIRTNNSVKILDNTSSFYVGTCLQPIELTKNWLSYLGFMTDDIEWWNGLISLGIYKDGLFYCPTESISYRLSKIEYVHQLQNLHFALTGEELSL